MPPVVFLFILAANTGSMPAKTAWYECLESYSQVEMLGKESTVTVALDAMKACSEERKGYQLKLLRAATTRNSSNGQSLAELLADEDREAARHTVRFLIRYRSKQRSGTE